MIERPSRIGRIVDVVGVQGWIALGLAAGVALAWRVSRRGSRRTAADWGPWDGERGRTIDANAAAAS